MKENPCGLRRNKEIDPEKAGTLCGKNFPVIIDVLELTITNKDTWPDQANLISTWYGAEVATPVHLVIEGDNLISLACLCYTHKEKINIIYIDPPYNTGNKDFMYNDRWIDDEHKDRKSIWISFMEKRLKQAKILLSEDGVIFISIDDNMLYELKLLCDEVLRPENFVANITWVKRRVRGRGHKHIIPMTEYILCYAKSIDKLNAFKIDMPEDILNKYSLEDDNGKYQLLSLEHSSPKGAYVRKTLQYDLKLGDREIYCGTGQWLWSKERAAFEYGNGGLEISKDSKNRWRGHRKCYLDADESMTPPSIIDDKSMTTVSATKELNSILGDIDVTLYPKPSNLIKYLVSMCKNKNATVLDFFAGSGTTGHAVLALNKEDGGKRQFILCTNNENNICTDVCYPRIKKVMVGYKKPNGEKVEGLGGTLKYFKTDFVEWHDNIHELAYRVGTTCSGLLRTKEGVYNELENNDHYELYYQDDNSLLAIYKGEYSVHPDAKELKELKDIMNGLDNCTSKVLYVFSVSDENDMYLQDEFKDWEGVEVKLMPIEMIKEYKNLFNRGILKKGEV